MTEHGDHPLPKPRSRRRCCLIVVILILALTVFKAKDPRVQVLSASIEGVSPRISFPVITIELNVTLNLTLRLHNPNHASFKHGPGKSSLLYQAKQVGEAELNSGFIPSTGTVTIPCRLTIEADKLASNLKSLISDILSGHLVMETRTTIPGRVNFLGIFKKHAVATSACKFTIAFPAMKIQDQECKSKTKL
uniref:Late embryogenesis abundant protein LEA-2 subgroup domain-containing protein n=1 Tax=Manihot esculenta TaxID=3983 RepID=A0A2C9VBK1_MANES